MTLGPAVIFDFDDTLIFSRSDRAYVLLEALELFGVVTNSGRIDEHWGKPFRDLVSAIAPELSHDFDAFLHYYAKFLTSRPPTARVGVVDALPRLAVKHHLYVHSSSHSLLVRTDLQSLGLLHFFDFICGSEWQPQPKPDPRSLSVLRDLSEGSGQGLDTAWYVGDSLTDLEITKRSDLNFIGVAFTSEAASVFRDHGVPDNLIVSDLRALELIIA